MQYLSNQPSHDSCRYCYCHHTRLQYCAVNTENVWIESWVKILIKCFVKKSFSLLGGIFPLCSFLSTPLVSERYFPLAGFDPLTYTLCWRDLLGTTQPALPLQDPRPFFIQLAFFILVLSCPTEDRMRSMGDNFIKEAFASHLEGHLLAGRLIRPWYWSCEKPLFLIFFQGWFLSPLSTAWSSLYDFIARVPSSLYMGYSVIFWCGLPFKITL